TVTETAPALTMSLAETTAESDVLPPNVVVRALPLICTIEFGVKFWPVAVTVKSEPPAAALVGVTALSTGAAGRGVTGSGVTFEKQPDVTHGDGAVMRMLAVPTPATSAACTAMSICVSLMTVTARGVPLMVAVDPATKLEPVTCKVKPGLPATTLAGEMAVMSGVGLMLATVKALLVAARWKPLFLKSRASYVPTAPGIVVVHVLDAGGPCMLTAYT